MHSLGSLFALVLSGIGLNQLASRELDRTALWDHLQSKNKHWELKSGVLKIPIWPPCAQLSPAWDLRFQSDRHCTWHGLLLGIRMGLFSWGAPAEAGLSLLTVDCLMPSLDGGDKSDVRRGRGTLWCHVQLPLKKQQARTTRKSSFVHWRKTNQKLGGR